MNRLTEELRRCQAALAAQRLLAADRGAELDMLRPLAGSTLREQHRREKAETERDAAGTDTRPLFGSSYAPFG